MEWKKFDSKRLVKLAEEQFPEESWLAESLAFCTEVADDGTGTYFYFTPRDAASNGKTEWEFQKNLSLRDPEFGELILDVLQNNRIGGIDFIEKREGSVYLDWLSASSSVSDGS